MRILAAAQPPFEKNGYLVSCERTREAVLIDPGEEVRDLLAAVEKQALIVKAILLTHAHFDHVLGVADAKAALAAPIWLHPDDRFLYDGLVEQGRLFGVSLRPAPPVDAFYRPSEALHFGDYQVDVLPTPGHSPGGVCLAIGAAASDRRELFVGDTLFAGSIGRTDLPGGHLPTLLASIQSVLFGFPDDTPVHAGHGPSTTIGIERRSNPFLA